MALHQLTYLDLTAEQRQLAASAARERLRQHTQNPFLTTEQAALLEVEQAKLGRWETGQILIQRSKEVP